MCSVFSRSLAFLLLFIGLGLTATSHAQEVGIGGHIGEPSGVTLKFHNAGAPSYDFLGAWSLTEDVVFINGHVLFENRIEADNIDRPLEWFVGPGGFILLTDEARLGVSGTVGLNLILTDHISIYGRITPRLSLIPDTTPDVGGGIGIRFFF